MAVCQMMSLTVDWSALFLTATSITPSIKSVTIILTSKAASWVEQPTTLYLVNAQPSIPARYTIEQAPEVQANVCWPSAKPFSNSAIRDQSTVGSAASRASYSASVISSSGAP